MCCSRFCTAGGTCANNSRIVQHATEGNCSSAAYRFLCASGLGRSWIPRNSRPRAPSDEIICFPNGVVGRIASYARTAKAGAGANVSARSRRTARLSAACMYTRTHSAITSVGTAGSSSRAVGACLPNTGISWAAFAASPLVAPPHRHSHRLPDLRRSPATMRYTSALEASGASVSGPATGCPACSPAKAATSSLRWMTRRFASITSRWSTSTKRCSRPARSAAPATDWWLSANSRASYALPSSSAGCADCAAGAASVFVASAAQRKKSVSKPPPSDSTWNGAPSGSACTKRLMALSTVRTRSQYPRFMSGLLMYVVSRVKWRRYGSSK
mmetsp:Transcript_45652/g.140727  ORF Transcript_45652/g.140727 Transcript_45652/m.140727 type:complete len:329 (-) Transcript_45652:173-1159(-)